MVGGQIVNYRPLEPFVRLALPYFSDLDFAETGVLALRMRRVSLRECVGWDVRVIGVMNIWTADSASGLVCWGMVLAHIWNARKAIFDASPYRLPSMCR